uniref:hypothetical protein n=1 Tax=Salmonella enterica TaxID=28901 RepID=UPI003F58287D
MENSKVLSFPPQVIWGNSDFCTLPLPEWGTPEDAHDCQGYVDELANAGSINAYKYEHKTGVLRRV